MVSSQKVDLWELSISRIVDEFLQYCANMEVFDLEVATEFALIAAVLVELKCRRLLPAMADPSLEDEFAFSPERDALLARLVECATFKRAGGLIAQLSDQAQLSIGRQAPMEEPFASMVPDVLAGVSAQDIFVAFCKAIAPPPAAPQVDLSHMAGPVPSVVETAAQLATEIERRRSCNFSELVLGRTRIEVVVAFLALLNLYKDGFVDVEQSESTAGDLVCRWADAKRKYEPNQELEREGTA